MRGQPDCTDCGGRLASSVVDFGDPLPEKELMLADRHARDCDLMLVLGSSLTVRPASSLVGLALRLGARVVLINRGGEPVPKAPLSRGTNVYRHLNLRLHAHHNNAFIADQDCNDEP